MNILAAQVRRKEVNLIMFTPNPAFERMKELKKICKQIRKPNPEVIKTQIKCRKNDFEVFVKHIKKGEGKYQKLDRNILDPDNSLPPFKTKIMKSKEIEEYIKAAKSANRDAEEEEENNQGN